MHWCLLLSVANTFEDFDLMNFVFVVFRETEEDWDLDIKEDVEEECTKLGAPPVHIYVDKNSQVLKIEKIW